MLVPHRLRILLILILGVVCAPAFAQPAQSEIPRTQAQSPDVVRRQDTFELVWKTVNETFFDPKFGGVDWKAVHERYAPLVAGVTSDEQLHLLLQQMVNELHQSHFLVISPRSIPKLTINDDENESAEGDTDPGDESRAGPTALDRIRTRLTQRLSTGIGIDLRIINGAAVITRVQPGSTADRAGLRPGLEIRSVNGKLMSEAVAEIDRNPIWHEIIRPELPEFLIGRYINGDLKSTVKLVYVDGINRQHAVEISREKLDGEMSPAIGNLPPIYTEFETRQLVAGIGYIRFNAFTPTLMRKVCPALRSMHELSGLIIDLRGNHGGLLGMIAGLDGLLQTDPLLIGSMQTRQGSNPMLAFPQRLPYTGALVLLVDGTSQSAAEIFAASLQESGRALVVGEISAGNVIPSAIIKLPTGALLQYGFAKYLSPRGSLLEARGVIPDWIVIRTRGNLLAGSDPQLTAGLKKLRERIAENRRPASVRVVTPPRLYGDPKTSAVTIKDLPPPPPPKPVATGPATDNAKPNDSEPSPKQLIEKYLEAVGGEKALLTLTSRVSIGTVEISSMGVTGRAELYEQAPNKSALVMSVAGLGVMRQTTDGKAQWFQDPLAGLISQSLAPSEEKVDRFHREVALRKLEASLRFGGRAKINGREALILSSTPASGSLERLFFDAENGLLLRRNSTYYEDYREVDGVRVPFTTRNETPYGFVVLRMREIKHNVPIESDKFVEVPDCFTGPGPTSH